ncbi:MAG: phosphodiester glycosidase family protein [Bacillota bacterium]|jgi:exopolysaccharide biosynthesis protein
MSEKKIIIITLISLSAVALGFLTAAVLDSFRPAINFSTAVLETSNTITEPSLSSAEEAFNRLLTGASNFDASLKKAQAEDEKISQQLADLATTTASHKNLSQETYEKMIINRLGQAIYTSNGTNSSIMIFELRKEDFRGYMAKIKLKKSSALRVTISPDSKPKGETTSQAAQRMGAIFAVNGGGFATLTTNGVAKTVPLGNTMINGKLIGEFVPSVNNLAFAGFSKNNKLVGGVYKNESELKASGAYQGVSFVPVLIRDWDAIKIPSKWAKARQPRTVLGQYPNGDIFFIVVDGRRSNWSSGITLEEMQILLMRLGVMEAFNLDGGGSSAMYYNGKVLNKPSDGKQRNMATNIVVFK